MTRAHSMKMVAEAVQFADQNIMLGHGCEMPQQCEMLGDQSIMFGLQVMKLRSPSFPHLMPLLLGKKLNDGRKNGELWWFRRDCATSRNAFSFVEFA